jgi:uncharacterized protein (DUF934 family)
VVPDTWQTIEDGALLPTLAADAMVIVPLPLLREHRASLEAREGALGVRLGVGDDVADVVAFLPRLALIAIEFPVFSDGRGFSKARLLRERWGFRGELRAVGDVLRDQIFYLLRCGFDAFAVRADKDIHDALLAFDDFSDSYQGAVDEPRPAYRRTRGPVVEQGETS